MELLWSLRRDQRGSALLIAMVMIVVITVLGLALFELGQIEGQQSQVSLGDARAFELAQAGLERAIRELTNDFLADDAANPLTASWVDGPNKPVCAPACEPAVYRQMTLANRTIPVAGASPLTGQDPGGTFTVDLKQVLVAEANNPVSQGAAYSYPYGQTCIPSAPTNPTVCANLMFVRSTGTVAGPPGYTAIRTVQTLVKATSTSYFAGGLTAQKASSGNDPAVDGRVLIAGSIQILGRTGGSGINPAFQISGGSSWGMRNSWFDLWPDNDAAATPVHTLARLTPRQLICPTGADCTGGANLVESLGAELKIYGDTVHNMVTLNGSTDLGLSAQTANYGDATNGVRKGKGPIDGVYVADGCAMPCSTKFSLGGTIYVDTNNYTKPYPDRRPKLPLVNQGSFTNSYPTVDDSIVISGTTYAAWYAGFIGDRTVSNALLSPLGQQPPGVNLTNGQFNGTWANGGYCGADYITSGGNPGRLQNILNDFNDDDSNQGSWGFCHTFKFVNKAGVLKVGEICWRRRNAVNHVSSNLANLPPNHLTLPTLEFGSPSCDVPTGPADPLLIFFNSQIQFSPPAGGANTYQYRGAAVVYTHNSDIEFQHGMQSACAADPCTNQKFPEDNLLILINRQGANVIIADNGTVRRVMAYVYSEGAIQMRKVSNIVGSLRGQQICFNNSGGNGCGVGSGGGNPSFFQASFVDLRKIPPEMPGSSGDPSVGGAGDRWMVNVVPRFWMACRRGPGDVLPATPTGTCQYR